MNSWAKLGLFAAGIAAAPPAAAGITGERFAVAHIIRLRYMGRSGGFPLTAYAEQGENVHKKDPAGWPDR